MMQTNSSLDDGPTCVCIRRTSSHEVVNPI